MALHKIKILPQYYKATAAGNKHFELRKNDRNYQLNDYLQLNEFDGENYTGREITVYITYILKGGQYGLQEGYCILGTRLISIKKID